jgi:hypothetical protein
LSELLIRWLFNDVSIETYVISAGRMIFEWYTGKDLEGSGRGLKEVPSRNWRDWVISRKPSIRIGGVLAEIRSKHLPNM